MRIRSPSRAPPEKGEEGSTARIPTRLPRARKAPTIALVKVDLPTPGLPVMPKMCARPVWGARADITSRNAGWPSSTNEISRATARGAPALAASTRAGTSTDLLAISESSLLGDANDQGIALPATTAQGGRTHAATTALELQHQVQRDAGPRHADRVPDCDRATVDVHLVGVDAQKLGGCQPDRRKCLVDLDELKIGGADALLRTGRRDGLRRLTLQRGVRAGHDAMGTNLGEPAQPELFGLCLAHHHDGCGAIGDR